MPYDVLVQLRRPNDKPIKKAVASRDSAGRARSAILRGSCWCDVAIPPHVCVSQDFADREWLAKIPGLEAGDILRVIYMPREGEQEPMCYVTHVEIATAVQIQMVKTSESGKPVPRAMFDQDDDDDEEFDG